MATVHMVLVVLYAFFVAHQLAIYGLVTAIASLVYPVLDKNKYAHAIFSFLAASGIDLPKIWNAVVRMLPGAQGTVARAAMKTLPILALCLGVMGTITGCATTAAWWAEIEANPASAISQFVSYVSTFISTAQAVWTVVGPLLGSQAPAANSQFGKAVVDVQNSLAVLQDGVKAAEAAQQAKPDFTTAIAAVQDAVSKVYAVIQQYSGGDAGVVLAASGGNSLDHQAQVIATWH